MKNNRFKKCMSMLLVMTLLTAPNVPLQAEGLNQAIVINNDEINNDEINNDEINVNEETQPVAMLDVLLAQDVTTPPTLQFNFDDYESGEIVLDKGSGKEAKLVGKASIKDDIERGKVLNLVADGGLELPQDLFANTNGDDGFSISFDVKIDASAARFSRMFDSSCYTFKKGNNGTVGYWADEEIGIVAGRAVDTSTTYDAMVYANKTMNQIKFTSYFSKGIWQNVALAMKKDNYQVYIDNELVFTSDNSSTLKKTLAELFNTNYEHNITTFKYTYLGRSLYGSDKDFAGQIDNFKFYNQYMDGSYFIKGENITKIKDVEVNGNQYAFNNISTLEIPINSKKDVPAIGDIIVHPVVEGASVEISRLSSATTPTFAIKVTSKSGTRTATYYIKFILANGEQLLEFDMTDTKGAVGYYASGMLYGIAEPDVPTYELVAAVKPQVVEQKPPQGMQHPTGDALRVADTLVEAGIQQIQIAVQDTYLKWPYDNPGTVNGVGLGDLEILLDDYIPRALDIVGEALEDKNSDKYVFVIFNEPNWIWFAGNFDKYLESHKRVYQAIKEKYPQAQIAGMNEATYNADHWEQFIPYCIENNVLPDVMTWHELSDNSVERFQAHFDHYKATMIKNGLEEEFNRIPVVINEYGQTDGKDMGKGGKLIRYVARFEYNNVFGCLAYWNKANSMNELAADANEPNGAWWLYKWYADMTGEKAQLYTYVSDPNGLYGLASINNEIQTAYALFGGQTGTQTVALNHIAKTEAFKNASKVHVKLYRASYTGFMGTLDAPKVEFDGDVAISNDEVLVQIDDADINDTFYAVVTPATGDEVGENNSNQKWSQMYEAENANLSNANSVDHRDASKGKFVELGSNTGKVTFNVDVPQDGKYRVDLLYSNNTPSGAKRGQGRVALHQLNADDKEQIEFYLDSTLNKNYMAGTTLYIDLEKGKHTLAFTNKSNKAICLDRIELIYGGEIGKEYAPSYSFKANETEKKGNATLFNVVVRNNGYYDLELTHNTSNDTVSIQDKVVNYAKDAKTETPVRTMWKTIVNKNLKNDRTSLGTVYLTAGINQMQIITSAQLDALNVSYNIELTNSKGLVIEAEEGELHGTAAITEVLDRGDIKVVENIGVNKDNYLNVTVNVPEEADYRMVIHYSNNEPASAINGYLHPYNVDLIERAAQISINNETPQTVYFINTLSWSTIKTKVIDVRLRKGENTISLYNDNAYQYQGIAGYTPNFDKFEFYEVYNESIELSSDCDVVQVKIPTQAIINGTDISAQVDSQVAEQQIQVEVSEGATWKLYSDIACTEEIANQKMLLQLGENISYIKVVAEDGTSKVYALKIERKEESQKSSDCDVVQVKIPTQAIINGTDISAQVDSQVAEQQIQVEVSKGATWKLYSDIACTKEIANQKLLLQLGENISYIKVVAEDGTVKIYNLTIVKNSSSGGSSGSSSGSSSGNTSSESIVSNDILLKLHATVTKQIMNELNNSEGIDVKVSLDSHSVSKDLLVASTGVDPLNTKLLKNIYTINLSKEGTAITIIKNPIKVDVDLSDVKLTEKQKKHFTAVCFDEKMQNYQVLGGEFSNDGKTFSFYTNELNRIGIMVVKDLSKIKLSIGETKYQVNGENRTSDVAPLLKESRTILPLRTVAEALLVDVTWDQKTKTVVLVSGEQKIELSINTSLPNNMGKAEIIDKRTYVPIRYILEQLKANVVWDDENKEIYIYR